MGRKNPLIAFLLNFLFGGAGFIYLEQEPFVLGGIILVVASLISSVLLFNEPLNATNVGLSLTEALGLGILGVGATGVLNRSIPPPPSTMTSVSDGSFVKNCVNCGREIPTAWEECQYCHASQRNNKATVTSSQMPIPPPPQTPSTIKSETEGKFCIHCGTKNPSVAVFCRKCGEKIED